ncbi:Glycosyltransferase involved in cell wall bisynthesis [Psychrobacillus sp. OK028]|uniref:glycosyltransferase n=1 Tax=Psychrobacillus sp. OK028 TaxID=1884359 RepID=UPI00088CEA60|nr:glycosyltransferase [Psychrobacillus sp. OK028]SDO00506.1 Glycosyltransferase involved in cell wall bisynthesis [Psychrobacillus sp. OK028]
MKVLQINSVCGIGSTGRIATDIHDILLKQGHESYIAYGRGTPQNCDTALRVGTDFDNYSHVALTRIYDKHGFGSTKATSKFIKEVEKLDPDIIHLHNIHGYFINIEILFEYLKRSNKPVIWTLHDCWSFTGHCSHFDFIDCNKWKTGCFKCPQTKEYPSSLMCDNSENNYFMKKKIFKGVKNLTIVTPSKWLAGLVEKSFLGEYPIKIINNGIDLNVFKPTKSSIKKKQNLTDDFIILGVASGWSERKGFKNFIELSNRLNDNEKIILVGLTEKQKKGLPPNVVGITRTNNVKELAEIYTLADVFVNLTLEDNFPTTNLESLACGTPVITYNTGGSVESIDSKSGFIVAQGNITQVLDLIRMLKNEDKGIYTDKCIERSILLYDKDKCFKEYINLYSR